MRNKLMSTTSIATIALATGLATSAFAPKASAAEWGGFYLGAHVGAGQAEWGGVLNEHNAPAQPSENIFGDQLNTDGILGGVHGGWQWQSGRGVFGIEGDWSWMDWSDRADPRSNTDVTLDGEVDSIGSVRARIGYVVGADEQVLLFLSAGVAWADASGLFCTSSDCSTFAKFDFDDEVGGVVGAGCSGVELRTCVCHGGVA